MRTRAVRLPVLSTSYIRIRFRALNPITCGVNTTGAYFTAVVRPSMTEGPRSKFRSRTAGMVVRWIETSGPVTSSSKKKLSSEVFVRSKYNKRPPDRDAASLKRCSCTICLHGERSGVTRRIFRDGFDCLGERGERRLSPLYLESHLANRRCTSSWLITRPAATSSRPCSIFWRT